VEYEVRVVTAVPRPTAVVKAVTSWEEFPTLWGKLLDQVWTFVRGSGLSRRGRNVMLYLDDVPNVEVGVEVAQAFRPSGAVVPSTLPAGRAATTVHRGPYVGLGDAHRAVTDWCAAQGLELAGTRWEVYGHHHDDPAQLETEVFWLLA
jgi:effector-binding domain-containing protein